MIPKERLLEIQRSISQRGCAVLTSFQCGRLSMVESLIEECGEDWLPIVEFMNNPTEGWRWVFGIHVDPSAQAYFDEGKFWLNEGETRDCFMAEYLTHVSPIKPPSPPK